MGPQFAGGAIRSETVGGCRASRVHFKLLFKFVRMQYFEFAVGRAQDEITSLRSLSRPKYERRHLFLSAPRHASPFRLYAVRKAYPNVPRVAMTRNVPTATGGTPHIMNTSSSRSMRMKHQRSRRLCTSTDDLLLRIVWVDVLPGRARTVASRSRTTYSDDRRYGDVSWTRATPMMATQLEHAASMCCCLKSARTLD